MTISMRRIVVWHLIVAPCAGALAATALYTAFLRPALPAPGWLLDAGAIVCGTIGLLAGGALGFTWAPPSPEQSPASRRFDVPRRASIATFGLSGLALTGAVLLAGIPVSGATGLALAVCAIVGAVIIARRL